MIGNLDGQVALAAAHRKVPLANSMPIASRFDPRLPTTPGPAEQKPLRYSADTASCPNIRRNCLRAYDASRRLDRQPRPDQPAPDGAIPRPHRGAQPQVAVFALVAPERALKEADSADGLLRSGKRLGPLHGIPYGLKDLFDTAGLVTGWGAEPFRDRVPDRDAAIVVKLRAAGAVLLGKTAVGALAYNDIWYGGQLVTHGTLTKDRVVRAPVPRLPRLQACAGSHRYRDAWVDHVTQPALRHHWAATDLRARLARRRDVAVLVARQGGTDLPGGRGYRDGPGSAQWL